MTSIVHLEAGPTACDIRPDLGACLTGLWHGGQPVLRSTSDAAALKSARQAGSYPLVPFSNRVAHAVLRWDSTGHPLVRPDAAEPHAIHGVGWQRPWEVLDAGPSFALLSHEHRGGAAWPFAYDASQSLRLVPGALEMTLSVTNQSGRPAPMGLGWHPWFVKRPGARLQAGATGRWDMGDDKLPTRRLPSAGLAGPCDALEVDHCYDGWDGVAVLEDAQLRIAVRSALTRVVVCTSPARDVIAIEPVSHVNNAFGLLDAGRADAALLGVRVLAPGESMSVEMTIEMETRA